MGEHPVRIIVFTLQSDDMKSSLCFHNITSFSALALFFLPSEPAWEKNSELHLNWEQHLCAHSTMHQLQIRHIKDEKKIEAH